MAWLKTYRADLSQADRVMINTASENHYEQMQSKGLERRTKPFPHLAGREYSVRTCRFVRPPQRTPAAREDLDMDEYE
jgi:hypothetical protein